MLRRIILPLLLLIPGLLGAQNLIQVEFKVFPQPYTVMSGGTVLDPYAWNGPRRWYRLPEGARTLTLSAEGYLPLRITAEVRPGLMVQEKLEPRTPLFQKTARITTGKGPKSLIFTPDSTRLLVPLVEDGGIDVISLSTLELLPRLTPRATVALKGFSEGAQQPGTGDIWISQFTTGTIHVFDGTTLELKDSFSAGSRGNEVISFTPDGTKAVVTNGETRQVLLVDAASRRVEKTLVLAGVPRGTAFSPDGRTVFITRFDGALVDRLDMGTFTLTATLNYGATGAMRHAASFGSRLYFSDMLRGGLITAEAPSGRFLQYLALGPNLTTITTSPDGRYVLAASRGLNNPTDFTKPGPDFGRIFLVDTQSNTITATLWGGNQPTGLAVSPDGKWAAFSNFLDNTVEIYRLRIQ